MAQYSFERVRPEYEKFWQGMHVVKASEALAEARWVIAHKDRLKAQEKLTRVPWAVAGCLILREAGQRRAFESWAHNGDAMRDRNGQPIRTKNVTANRPPNPDCTWEEGCYDAYIVCDTLGVVSHWTIAYVAYAAEKFNGWAYRSPRINIPSPYLWGGTSVQKRGKFIRDHVYDATVMDPQIGVMAVLWAVMELDPEARFEEAPPTAPASQEPDQEQAPEEEPVPPQQSPKAHDTETGQQGRLKVSRTMWGGVLQYGAGAWAAVEGFWDKINDPIHLTMFLAILGLGSGALYMVITGRINVQKLVAHLAYDDTQENT
jgi:lysozyme family protein